MIQLILYLFPFLKRRKDVNKAGMNLNVGNNEPGMLHFKWAGD